jgi:ABC-type Mn2+/Zn2+ transport system ATPase subunit
MRPPLIKFESVSLGYGSKPVFQSLNFSIEHGDFLGIVGPNGAGKTTILRGILGILKPTTGKIILKDGNPAPLRIGYVPQRESLDEIFPMTVSEVVIMGCYHAIGPGRRAGPKDYGNVMRALSELGIADLANRLYRDISGGQKQRTLIARALVGEPEILVLDEPTNGMDLPSQKSILDLIALLHEKKKLTVVLVSHLLNEVAAYVKRLALVDQEFFQIGTTDEILTEENLSQLYGIKVNVDMFNHHRVIIPGEGNGGAA